MNGPEFASAIRMLFGSSQDRCVAGAADFLEVSVRTVKKWQAGEAYVPVGVHEALIEALRASVFDMEIPSPSALAAAEVIRAAIAREREAA